MRIAEILVSNQLVFSRLSSSPSANKKSSNVKVVRVSASDQSQKHLCNALC